jgi:hypothetical protein
VARAAALQPEDHVKGLGRRPRPGHGDPEHAADAIAVDRIGQRFLADDVANPTRNALRRRGDELQPLALGPAPGAKQRIERANAGETVAAGTLAARRSGRRRRDQGVSRSRPLARRAESTLRPPTVFIRARKPCVRLRLTTEGWYVRFMIEASLEKALH